MFSLSELFLQEISILENKVFRIPSVDQDDLQNEKDIEIGDKSIEYKYIQIRR